MDICIFNIKKDQSLWPLESDRLNDTVRNKNRKIQVKLHLKHWLRLSFHEAQMHIRNYGIKCSLKLRKCTLPTTQSQHHNCFDNKFKSRFPWQNNVTRYKIRATKLKWHLIYAKSTLVVVYCNNGNRRPSWTKGMKEIPKIFTITKYFQLKSNKNGRKSILTIILYAFQVHTESERERERPFRILNEQSFLNNYCNSFI